MQVAEDDPRAGSESQRKRRVESPAPIMDKVASGKILIMKKGVETKRRAPRSDLWQRLVQINRGAVIFRRSIAERQVIEAIQLRRLAHHVDRPSSGAAARINGIRPFKDFDLLHVEGIARVAT